MACDGPASPPKVRPADFAEDLFFWRQMVLYALVPLSMMQGQGQGRQGQGFQGLVGTAALSSLTLRGRHNRRIASDNHSPETQRQNDTQREEDTVCGCKARERGGRGLLVFANRGN